jgi:pheromone shutdown protein TraB
VTTDTATLRRRLASLAGDDPRLDGQYVRLVDAAPEPVVLVGVVHDHPASVHRADRVVAALDPDLVAIEAPDAATPAFASHARADDEYSSGGEMTAAVAAAGDAAVVGIDVPGRGTLRSLASVVSTERPDGSAVAGALGDLCRIGVHAARSRLRTAGVPAGWIGGEPERSHEYDCSSDDNPRAQAAHESRRLERSTSLLRAFDPPPATRVLDAVRERQMGRRLAALAENGLVVAVVGFSHLDGVENEFRDA